MFGREIREKLERKERENLPKNCPEFFFFFFFGSNEGLGIIYSEKITIRLSVHLRRVNITYFVFFYFLVLTSIAYLKAFLDLD